MDCDEVAELLLDHQRGRLAGEPRVRLAAHLESCPSCRRAAEAESALSEALAGRLPRYSAPDDLKRRLAERAAAPSAPRPARSRRYAAPLVSALAAAALVLVVVRLTHPGFLRPPLGAGDLIEEAVNDHLRVVASSHPLEIESGGIHQVKPWFTGRLDFAPRLSFAGDEQFHLDGGSVGYFRDRKAAVLVWKLRLHTISLFVFRAEGLPVPARAAEVSRGFSVLLWREGELGYCLVSDVSRADLDELARRIATGS